MKMIKVMKKLKFWSRKKRKKKYSSYDPYFDYHYQPPSTYRHSTYHYSCSSSSSSLAQPSAPPLPPWLEQELTREPVCEPCWVQSVPGEKEVVHTSQTTHHNQFASQEVIQETSPMLHHPTPTLPVESISSSSYQQYMDPNPAYGLPVVQTSSANIERKSSDIFGYFVRSGLNLVGCFFPCFTIREADHDKQKLHAPYKKL